jgi:8-oxo-dGTP pyrophosphatase MutT (NUDIX family)
MSSNAINIVDEDNNLTGVKARNEIDYSVDRYQCTGLMVRNLAGELLIAQRSLQKDKDPGLWGPAVSGTVDAGETFDTNIYKEAQEEIGLTGVLFTKGPLFKSDTPRRHFAQWFFVELDWPLEAYTKEDREVEQLAFVTPEALLEGVASHPERYVATFGQYLPKLIALMNEGK